LDWCGSGEGPVEGSCGNGNEPSDSIKYWEVLECLHNLRLLKRAQLHEWVMYLAGLTEEFHRALGWTRDWLMGLFCYLNVTLHVDFLRSNPSHDVHYTVTKKLKTIELNNCQSLPCSTTLYLLWCISMGRVCSTNGGRGMYIRYWW
jgi:hypothetical protein